MTTDLAALLLGALVLAVTSFTGGWYLRGLRDRSRAEVARDREWDETHGLKP